MPGPVSDSYDPEFGTGENATTVRDAIADVRRRITKAIGSERLDNIVAVADRVREMPSSETDRMRRLDLTEAECRVIRFCMDRAMESI